MRKYSHTYTAAVILWIFLNECTGQGSTTPKPPLNCGPGEYINRDANACRQCGIATFNPYPNAEVCFPCPEGQTTERIGTKYIAQCIGPCEQVKFPCQLTATYGVPGQCDKYFQCSHGGGLLSVQMCPSGTFFNPFRKVCDIYLNMECTPVSCPAEFVKRLLSYTEMSSTTTMSTTTKEFVTHKQTKPCGEASLPCNIGETWSSPGRCDRYIECTSGMEYLERPCPRGTMYSDIDKSCGRNIQCVPTDCDGNVVIPTDATRPPVVRTTSKRPTRVTSPVTTKTTATERPSTTSTKKTTVTTTTTTPTPTTTLPIFPNITTDPGIVVTYKGTANKSSEQEDGGQYTMLVVLAILILVVLIVAVVGGLCMWKRRAIKRRLRRKRRAQRHVDNPEYVWKTEEAYVEINDQHIGRSLPKKPNIPLPEVPNEEPIYNSIPDVVHEHRPKTSAWNTGDASPKHHPHHHHESRKPHETSHNNSGSHQSPKHHSRDSPKHHKARNSGHAQGTGNRVKHGHGKRARENSTKELISPGPKDSNTYSHAWD